MDKSWDKFEPAPLEFFHGALMDEFHILRIQKGDNEHKTLTINGSEFGNLIAKVKLMTYEKYSKQNLGKPIPKTEM